MKKLRMIVTSVIVLAIVGSAFAFNAKKVASFCIDTSSPLDGTCDVIKLNYFIDPTSLTTFHYYNGWSGKTSACAGNTHCTSFVNVTQND
jgi:hypothetical protein